MRVVTSKKSLNMENLEKKIAAVEYNPDRFVKELSRTRVGGAELQLAATTIRELADHYSRTLKKSVYHNHLHFRDTAQQVTTTTSLYTR